MSVYGKGPERRDGTESDLLKGWAFGIRRQEASLLGGGRIVGHFLHSLVVSQKAATTEVPFEALGRTHSFYISTQKLSFISPQKQLISG